MIREIHTVESVVMEVSIFQFLLRASPAEEAAHKVSGQAGPGRDRQGAQGEEEGEEEQ